MKITHSFKDFEEVKKAFFDFVKTLVENSKDECEHISQSDLKKEVNSFCNNYGTGLILEVNKHFEDYQKAKEPRYTVEMQSESLKEPRVIKVETFHSLLLAVTDFAEKNAGKRHKIIVFDNKENKIIANLI